MIDIYQILFIDDMNLSMIIRKYDAKFVVECNQGFPAETRRALPKSNLVKTRPKSARLQNVASRYSEASAREITF